MNPGDLLGSGTISGADPPQRGSLLELRWGGQEPIELDNGETRSFLEDDDQIVMTGAARSETMPIGFGTCVGRVLPALENPYER